MVAATVSGSLKADFDDVSVGVHLESVSGNIDLKLPDSKGFSVEARALGFDFDRLKAGETVTSIRSSNASAEVRGGGIPVRLSTISGRIRVEE
jgi:hypothetical protein